MPRVAVPTLSATGPVDVGLQTTFWVAVAGAFDPEDVFTSDMFEHYFGAHSHARCCWTVGTMWGKTRSFVVFVDLPSLFDFLFPR